jgi:sulfite reductase beta subunit-like hemoprotein
MREIAAEGLTTREACGNSVRNVTGCPYAGTSPTEVFDVTPYAEALTRYFLRHPLSGVLPRKFKIAFEGCAEDHAYASINDIGWRARIVDGRKGFRMTIRRRHVDHAGERLCAARVPAGRRDAERGGGRRARLPPVR